MADPDERVRAPWMRPVLVTIGTNTPFELPVSDDRDTVRFGRTIERGFDDDDETLGQGEEDYQDADPRVKRCRFFFVGVLFGRMFGSKQR
jgi:hypothetical protein